MKLIYRLLLDDNYRENYLKHTDKLVFKPILPKLDEYKLDAEGVLKL